MDAKGYIEKYNMLVAKTLKANEAYKRADAKREEAEKNYQRYVTSKATVETIKKYTKAYTRASSFRATKLAQFEQARSELYKYMVYLKNKGIMW